MGTPSTKDRVRAHALRKKKQLTAPDKAWLDVYEKSTRRATIEEAKRNAEPAPSLPASAPASSFVQSTVRINDTIQPDAHVWNPEVPPAPADAPPPSPGAPPPMAAGTPLVAGAAPAGDPKAAEQFTAIIVGITAFGIKSALELADDGAFPVPQEWLELVRSPDMVAQVLTFVGSSAHAVAVKRGFRAVPMADELTVVAAVAGSALVSVANIRRKQADPKKTAHQAQRAPLRSVPRDANPSRDAGQQTPVHPAHEQSGPNGVFDS